MTKETTETRPVRVQMLGLLTGHWVSCALHVAARLSIADYLAKGPKTIDELASASKSHGPTLYRLLRMLAAVGVFHERTDGRFENTPLSESLRADVPGSMRAFAVMMVDGYNLHAWADLLGSMKSGEQAFQRVFKMRVFEYFSAHPAVAREFGEAMTSLSAGENPVIAAAYDYSAFAKLIDVGGGHGSLMSAILQKAPKLRGVVYDRAEVIAAARASATARDASIANRCDLVSGDFFESVPSGADACIMKYILHDWEDELCIKLLSNCRRALGSQARVLVCDTVIPPGNDPHWGKLLDINMLVLTGGRERTEKDFAQLFAKAGFRLTRVIPTASALCIVEGQSQGA